MAINKCDIAKDAVISELTNLYGCKIEKGVFIGPFVEIQSGSIIGIESRISSHTFICSGVTIGKNCFIGHGVMFINDNYSEGIGEWILKTTSIGDNVRIGSNATIMPVIIGNNVIIGAGSVVTNDVKEGGIVFGNPARSKGQK